MGIELLFQEENDLKEKLLINENAIKFINNYIDRFSFIYDKTSSLLKDTINLEKKQTMINNSIKHIENTIANIYGDNVIYESKFGTMLVDEIKSKADKYIEKLKQIPCGCEELTQDILNDFANISFHSEPPLIEYTPPEVETDYALLPEETHIEPIPVEDIDPISYDESSFVDEMQKGFIEHVEKHHPKTLKKIIKFEKVEDKELERLIKSYMKMNKDIPIQIEKYGQARESQEERLNDIYEEKYGDKYKRKKDNTIFENPHYKKWIKKNMLEMSGGRSIKRRVSSSKYSLPNVKKQKVESLPLDVPIIMPIHLSMNYLLETIDLFEIDDFPSSSEDVQTGGFRKKIIDTNFFVEKYDIFRLLSDMKHDFGDLFKSVWKEIPYPQKNIFEDGIYSEVQFMAKVISVDPTKFYSQLYVDDATRESQIKRLRNNNEGQTAAEFNKEYLKDIESIVCDMPLGQKYHFDPVDCKGTIQEEIPTKLTRVYTLGNHLDPSPVKGRVSKKLYPGLTLNDKTLKIENHDFKLLNEIIKNFFESFFEFVAQILLIRDQNEKKAMNILIPQIKEIFLINQCSYVYNFTEFEKKSIGNTVPSVGFLKGTDFEISQIKNGTLLRKLPPNIKTNLKRILKNESLIKLYLMTYKELGDHIQLHELKNIRENNASNSDINKTVFGTRDQILISDSFYQDERLLFWTDSVKGKFDPGMKINTLANYLESIKLEESNFLSYLFYFSKDHADKFAYDEPDVLKECVDLKKKRYIGYLSDKTCTIKDNRKNILLSILSSNENNDHMRLFMSLLIKLYNLPTTDSGPLIHIFNKALGPASAQENDELKRILKAMYLTDLSFEALSQYEAINKDRDIFKNKIIVQSIENGSIVSKIKNFIPNVNNKIDALFNLRYLQKFAYNIYPTYQGFNQKITTFSNMLTNFSSETSDDFDYTEHINLSKLLNSNFHIYQPINFDPTLFIEQVDKKIREVQEYITSDDADLEKMISDLEGENVQMNSF